MTRRKRDGDHHSEICLDTATSTQQPASEALGPLVHGWTTDDARTVPSLLAMMLVGLRFRRRETSFAYKDRPTSPPACVDAAMCLALKGDGKRDGSGGR
ncbi:hypothetical protein CCMA1212_002829 [Trichoderma ghanense]|uniref:Uncharacterized protein n=1 Tax=Trichoderma ghanense TaxID=65468 RepID=A0ABY2H9V9_9HYPO